MKKKPLRILFPAFLLFTGLVLMLSFPLPWLSGAAGVHAASPDDAPGREMAQQATKGLAPWTTVDHGGHEILQKEFKSGDEITRACLSCHNEADEQFRKTIHWTWTDPRSDKETVTGKAGHSINNFCISTNMTNDKSCLACHTGWKGKDAEVNCLVCHSEKKLNFNEAFED